MTPALAVINELKKQDTQLEAWFVCDRGFSEQAAQILKRSEVTVTMEVIVAGKVRRYHGIPWWRQLMDMPTTLANLRDLFLLGIGFVQSLLFLSRIRPDAVFTKGGFVCVPVGCAARLLGIPLIIHDSDTQPGLTNRLLARFATAIATGAPLSNYPYPKAISHFVGIPVDEAYQPANADERIALKRQLGYAAELPLLLFTGGGLGATRVNTAVVANAAALTERAQVVHLTGTKHISDVAQQVTGNGRYQAIAFTDDKMPLLVRAADVVVTRAGATTLLELAASARPTVIIPNPHLTSGHQLKNAAVYSHAGAAIVLDEAELAHRPELLAETIIGLLDNPEKCAALSRAIAAMAKPEAAKDVAQLIRSAAKKRAAGER